MIFKSKKVNFIPLCPSCIGKAIAFVTVSKKGFLTKHQNIIKASFSIFKAVLHEKIKSYES